VFDDVAGEIGLGASTVRDLYYMVNDFLKSLGLQNSPNIFGYKGQRDERK
jgi:hypothetical protein